MFAIRNGPSADARGSRSGSIPVRRRSVVGEINEKGPRNPAVLTVGGIGGLLFFGSYILVPDIPLDCCPAHIAKRAHIVAV